MNPKYLSGIKQVSGEFNYTVGGDGEFFLADPTGITQKKDSVLSALSTVVTDTMQISQDILNMLNAYMLEESVSLTPVIQQVMSGVTNTGNVISANVNQICEIIQGLNAAAQATNEALTQEQTAATNMIDQATGGAAAVDPALAGYPTSTDAAIGVNPDAVPAVATGAATVMPTGVDSASTAAMLGLTPAQLDVVKATIRHEAGNNPAEIANVASAVKNRMNSGGWGGTDPYSVVTASGQFESYFGGHYKQYTNGNYYQGDAGTAAAVDQTINAILTGQMAPTHGFESFRSAGSKNGTQLTEGGNKYC